MLHRLRAWAAFVLLAVVGALCVAQSPAAAAARTQASSPTVALSVTPSGPVSAYTRVTFTVRVTPPSSKGIVRLLAGGVPIGASLTSQGRAVMTTTNLPVGTLSVIAEFTSASGGPVSLSPPVQLVVAPDPQIWLTTPAGVPLAAGGRIRGGTQVIVHLVKFAPRTSVTLYVGALVLTRSVPINPAGEASVGVQIPRNLPSNVNLLVAAGGGRTASFPFYVDNPLVDHDPTPTPTPTRTKTPTPRPSGSSSDDQNISVTIRRNTLPDTGGDDDPPLAHTGSDAAVLVMLATTLLVMGVGLVVVSRSPSRQGRHGRS